MLERLDLNEIEHLLPTDRRLGIGSVAGIGDGQHDGGIHRSEQAKVVIQVGRIFLVELPERGTIVARVGLILTFQQLHVVQRDR